MTHVMEQGRQLHQFSVLWVDAPRMCFLKRTEEASCQVVGAERVREAVVRGAWKHELACSELFHVAQALKFTGVQNRGMSRRHEHVPVHFVSDDPVGRPRHRVLGRASLHQPLTREGWRREERSSAVRSRGGHGGT